jgi:predicted secreted protein
MSLRARLLRLLVSLLACTATGVVPAAAAPAGAPVEKFQQLDQLLPTPTAQRNAAGAPGPAYWQNRADYDIAVELDDVQRRIRGSATITYQNRSPDALAYLWLQLDQNYQAHDADSRAVPNTRRGVDAAKVGYAALDRLLARKPTTAR